jgi:hypothetical protein
VTQMTAMRQIQPHEAFMGTHEGLVDLQIGGTARKRLHIDSPFLRVEVEGLQSTSLASQLNGVNVLVASVVAGTGITLGVLVGHWGAESIVDSARGHILRGNQKDRLLLTLDLFLLQLHQTLLA